MPSSPSTSSRSSSYQYPMERVLFKLHRQICSHALRRTSGLARNLAERLVLVLAVCCFGALLLAHLSFVYRGCGAVVVGVENATAVPTTTTTTTGRSGGTREGTATAAASTSSLSSLVRNIPLSCLPSISGFSFDADVTYLSLLQDEKRTTAGDDDDREDGVSTSYAYVVQSTPRPGTCSSNSSPSTASSHRSPILLSYSRVKGYLLLPPRILHDRNITVQHVSVSRTDVQCFGEPFLRKLAFRLVGTDTVMLNWLLVLHQYRTDDDGETSYSSPSLGYAYNPRTDTMIDLNQYNSVTEISSLLKGRYNNKKSGRSYDDTDCIFSSDNSQGASERKRQQKHERSEYSAEGEPASGWYRRQMFSKLALVLKTSFLFFITTTLVSFTLRETQERMLDFTYQLQAYVRSHRPVARLVTTHLVENLVFVPIMVGMIFFLIEFYRGDKFLAFMVVSLVWLCEVFSVISLRSAQGIHFFPRIFFLLFALFHFYLFSFPFGFSYMAFGSTICVMAHSMLFFWHRYELPAVAHGLVTIEHPRMGVATSAAAAAAAGAALRTTPAGPAATVSPDSTPSLESDRASQRAVHRLSSVPVINLPPRSSEIARQPSTASSTTGGGRMFRPTSSGGIFHRVHDDDGDGSYMYFLEGEVIMQNRSVHNAPGSVAGSTSQLQSTGSIDSLSNTHNDGNHRTGGTEPDRHATRVLLLRDGGIPDRIMLTGDAASTEDDVLSLDTSGEQRQRDQRLQPGAPVDPPETSALQAILMQRVDETPRTENLSSAQPPQHRVRAAPTFPGL